MTEIAAVRLECVSARPTQLLSHTQRWRLRYGGAGWGRERGEAERDTKFLCDVFSPWGQGATVIQSYRAVVQKPPPIKMHCVDGCMKVRTPVRAEKSPI